MANIIKIARMIMTLEEADRSDESKIQIIEMHKGLGIITEEDARELILEYTKAGDEPTIEDKMMEVLNTTLRVWEKTRIENVLLQYGAQATLVQKVTGKNIVEVEDANGNRIAELR